jgi:hypothetical protein
VPGLPPRRSSRLADFNIEPLLGTLGFQLGDLRFLDNHLLPVGRLRERTSLAGQRGRLIDLSLVSGLLDLAVAAGLRLERVGLLLLLGRFAICPRLRDTCLPFDCHGMRPRHVLDVPGGVVDLLDLKGIDDQPELLHFRSSVFTGELRKFLAVADHFLDRHVADDRPKVAGEHVVHPLVHLILLIEEPARRIGDGGVIVTDLVDDNRADLERDALLAHTVDLQVGLTQVEGEATHHLDAREHKRALAGHNFEAEALPHAIRRPLVEARDDQGFIRLGDPPHHSPKHKERDEYGNDDANHHRNAGEKRIAHRIYLLGMPGRQARLTTIVRGGKYSTTKTRVPRGMASFGSMA